MQSEFQLTITIPLHDPLALKQRLDVACEDHVHVDPHAAVLVQREKAHDVSIDPRAAVKDAAHLVQDAFDLGTLGEDSGLKLAHLDMVGPVLREFTQARTAHKLLLAVRPEDELGDGEVLRSVEGVQCRGLSAIERRQVGAPVRMEDRLARRHLGNRLHCRGKVVARKLIAQVDTGGEQLVPRRLVLRHVVLRGDVLGLPAALQWPDRLNLLSHPVAREDRELELNLVVLRELPERRQSDERPE